MVFERVDAFNEEIEAAREEGRKPLLPGDVRGRTGYTDVATQHRIYGVLRAFLNHQWKRARKITFNPVYAVELGHSTTRITEDLYQHVRHQVHVDSAEKVVDLAAHSQGTREYRIMTGCVRSASVPAAPACAERGGRTCYSRSSGGRGIRTHGDVAATMVFKSMRGSLSLTAPTSDVQYPDPLR